MNIISGFSGFSVDDLQKAKQFYKETLGCKIEDAMGGQSLELTIPNNAGKVFIYPKPNHQPATYTVLNFIVDDINSTVDELTNKGVQFERYDGFSQDEKGIARGEDGPTIAWFKDAAGNILSLIQDNSK